MVGKSPFSRVVGPLPILTMYPSPGSPSSKLRNHPTIHPTGPSPWVWTIASSTYKIPRFAFAKSPGSNASNSNNSGFRVEQKSCGKCYSPENRGPLEVWRFLLETTHLLGAMLVTFFFQMFFFVFFTNQICLFGAWKQLQTHICQISGELMMMNPMGSESVKKNHQLNTTCVFTPPKFNS